MTMEQFIEKYNGIVFWLNPGNVTYKVYSNKPNAVLADYNTVPNRTNRMTNHTSYITVEFYVR